jgi:diaminopimelate epimerase
MTIRFEKYEGLGNDFVVVDVASPQALSPEKALQICDRHRGVGADGVLLVLPPATPAARARMLVLNADGSRPEMCGNGIRCVALHLARRDAAPGITYVIDTDAGPRTCEVERHGDLGDVTVDMGRAELTGEHVADLDGKPVTFTCVSVGNPHAIAFDVEASRADLDRFGPSVSGAFPEGCNVELARRVADGKFEVAVWERGVGQTLACGTGACATAVAAVTRNLASPSQNVEVRLPGGPLEIVVTAPGLGLRMRGPARRVFSGELT